MTNAIEIRNLTKEYGPITAVRDLTLTVPAGCFFGFLGPNGAGKSTTLSCLTGLLEPTSGSAHVPGGKRRIGVMPENLGLFEALYAHEFLAMQARAYGLDEATTRARVTQLLQALGLEHEGKKPISKFSTGMKKRVAFAAAILHAPDILFLDEPFESIDPAGVALLKHWLQRFVAGGRTVFLTTHVLETVEHLCSRAAIIRSPGELLWEGDITAFARGGLEALFLRLTGERYADVGWLWAPKLGSLTR